MTISTIAIIALMVAVVFLVIALWWLSDKYNRTCDEKNTCIRQLLAESDKYHTELKRLRKEVQELEAQKEALIYEISNKDGVIEAQRKMIDLLSAKLQEPIALDELIKRIEALEADYIDRQGDGR